MSYNDVLNALHDQVKASSHLSYVNANQFYIGFHEAIPAQEHTVIFEPGPEEEEPKEGYDHRMEMIYHVEIHLRVEFIGSTGEMLITGNATTGKKGILEFVDDVKQAIVDDWTLGYDRPGSSVSAANAGASFALGPSNKYISVSINGKTPAGYDTILCGESTLSGSAVASNIQSALRALGNHADDGYYRATCTFDNTSKQFTIATAGNHPDCSVTVTAGASDDCSALLGFDSPTEVVGRNIVKIVFDPVQPNNILFPVRYRVIPVKIWEEINREGG
jgi:hypothetical protein